MSDYMEKILEIALQRWERLGNSQDETNAKAGILDFIMQEYKKEEK